MSFVDWNRTVTHAVANYKQPKALRITFRVSRFPATTLGERIRKRRLEHGLKQVELAGLLGVNPRTIVNWEKDRTKPRSAGKGNYGYEVSGRSYPIREETDQSDH